MRIPYKCLSIILLFLSFACTANAAFPSQRAQIIVVEQEGKSEVLEHAINNYAHQLPKPEEYPKVKKRKTQVAAALYSFFLGRYGIHRFYLGYDWQGVLQVLTYPILIIGALLAEAGILLGPAGYIVPAIFILGGLALVVWEFVDFIRILSGTLKPATTEYSK